ncbi:MAG: hypothetical protein AAF514_23885, partial [Verrucomicrobiota bacterium]
EYTAAKEGIYRARSVIVDANSVPLGMAETGWTVNHGTREFETLTGNQDALDRLAQITKGESLLQEQIMEFVKSLPEKSAPVTEIQAKPLWHLPIFFILALLLFVGEWTVKRMRGLP